MSQRSSLDSSEGHLLRCPCLAGLIPGQCFQDRTEQKAPFLLTVLSQREQ